MQTNRRPAHAGIEVRHKRACASHRGRRCSCRPGYRAEVYSARQRRRIRKTFPTLAAAKAWRADAQSQVRSGRLRAARSQTLREAADVFLTGAREGSITCRSGEPYKPSTIRGYDEALRLRVLPALGANRLSEITHRDLRLYVERLVTEGLTPSTIHNTINPLRAIYRRALALGDVALNPCADLTLPAERGGRLRIAPPEEAAKLLAAAPNRDRALWATAFYTGLRRGELRALDWTDVDLEAGVIRVTGSWDRVAGKVAAKSRAGQDRAVPIPATLRPYLLAHRLRQGRGGVGLVFSTSSGRPFDPPTVSERAAKAWKRAGLKRMTLHECRHTYASLMIAAGVNTKTLSTYMGHASVGITLDRYGHLMPGAEREAAAMLDALLSRAEGRQVGEA